MQDTRVSPPKTTRATTTVDRTRSGTEDPSVLKDPDHELWKWSVDDLSELSNHCLEYRERALERCVRTNKGLCEKKNQHRSIFFPQKNGKAAAAKTDLAARRRFFSGEKMVESIRSLPLDRSTLKCPYHFYFWGEKAINQYITLKNDHITPPCAKAVSALRRYFRVMFLDRQRGMGMEKKKKTPKQLQLFYVRRYVRSVWSAMF